MIRAAALLLLIAATAGASELMDPPEIDGWRYSHRLYHGVAGAVIGFVADRALVAAAPHWCARHPALRAMVAEAFVVGAAVGKEAGDRAHGPESLHHSLTDVGVTALGGAVGIGVSFHFGGSR